MKWKIRTLLVAAMVTAVLFCTLAGVAAGTTRKAAPAPFNVFAAASLNHVFPAMVPRFKTVYPKYKNVKFVFNFQGTDILVQQIEQGASADVFAGASTKYGNQLVTDGLVGPLNLFCRNRLCVITPASNPAGIKTLGDLAGSGVLIAVGDAAVPIGTYTRTVVQKISTSGTYGTDYYTKVMANVAASATNVSAVVALVKLGEVDAGFCYVSDAQWPGTASAVNFFAIDDAYQSSPLPTYPIAQVNTAGRPAMAQRWMQFVMSQKYHRGQYFLKKYGFVKPLPLTTPSATPVPAPAG